jgi:hypothetical protein
MSTLDEVTPEEVEQAKGKFIDPEGVVRMLDTGGHLRHCA